LEQVNDFTPTPMTVATVIYYAGVHPYTLKPTYAPRTKQEKQDQHRFFFWHKPENQQWINDKLRSVGQEGLAERLVGRPNMANKPRKDSPNYKGGNQNSFKPKTKHLNRTKVETVEEKPMPKWLADKRMNQAEDGNSNSSRNKKKSRTGKKR